MTFADDIQNDYLLFDGVEDVAYGERNPTVANVTGVKALRRPMTTKANRGAAILEPTGCVFHVWVSTLGGKTIRIGDVLVAGDGEWRVQIVNYECLNTRYRCVCIKVP